ncbi:hypothetical protein [Janthinobacterium fluminis]|uniref:Uncharacterized protein n=1 Tax=Janthinobacterium fluminis TaxID=2987524 RepID=A0ABT5JYP9_9BURK|nr:hypothetical protein [Janthinobacterium fluminis]MDC8757854.1 hypothetical protein [Janthinobacterium fluminis]
MKKIIGLILAASTLFSALYAAGKETAVSESKPLKGSYSIYAGALGEEAAPTKNDRKIAIEITGRPAKEMFESMYPDYQPTCSGEKGDRDRRKGNVYCSFNQGVGYRCFLGIDLRTGKSIAGASC